LRLQAARPLCQPRFGGSTYRIGPCQQLSQAALQDGYTVFCPCNRPCQATLEEAWLHIQAAAIGCTRSVARRVQDTPSSPYRCPPYWRPPEIHQPQMPPSKALLASHDPTTITGQVVLARLCRVACWPAAAWLEAFPTVPSLHISDGMFRGAVAFTWEPHFSGVRAHNPTTPQRHPSNTPATASQTATARPHHQCARRRPLRKGGAHRVSTDAPDGDILLCRCRRSQHGLRCISSPGCPQACTVLGLPCGLLPMVPHGRDIRLPRQTALGAHHRCLQLGCYSSQRHIHQGAAPHRQLSICLQRHNAGFECAVAQCFTRIMG
jgi:hypothetical protein